MGVYRLERMLSGKGIPVSLCDVVASSRGTASVKTNEDGNEGYIRDYASHVDTEEKAVGREGEGGVTLLVDGLNLIYSVAVERNVSMNGNNSSSSNDGNNVQNDQCTTELYNTVLPCYPQLVQAVREYVQTFASLGVSMVLYVDTSSGEQ